MLVLRSLRLRCCAEARLFVHSRKLRRRGGLAGPGRDPGRPSWSTPPRISPASRPRPPMTCWSRCRASRSSRRSRGARARARPGDRERADQRPANRQQIGRRGRPAKAHLGRRGRADRDRRCRQPRHRRACRAGRERRPQGREQSVGPVRMGSELSRPLREARVSRGLDQLFGQERPGRLYLLGAEQLRAAAGSAGRSRSTTATAFSPRRRHEVYHSEYEEANLQAKFGIDGPGSSVANLTLGYTPYWNPEHIRDRREFVSGEVRSRTNVTKLAGYKGDINGDYEFALGPGRLKLIGVRHWDHEPLVTTQILHFDSSGAQTRARASAATPISARRSAAANIIGGAAPTTGNCRSSARSIRSTRRADCSISIQAANSSKRRSRRDRQGRRKPLREHPDLQPAAIPQSRPADRGRSGNLEARPDRRRSGGAQILPAQGQHHARLAAGQGLGRQPQASAAGRPDQLLRFPGAAQAQQRSRKCRQPQPRPAAKLGSRDRILARPRRMGQDPPQPPLLPGLGHRRRDPDRRQPGGRSATFRAPTASAPKASARSTSIRSVGRAPSLT